MNYTAPLDPSDRTIDLQGGYPTVVVTTSSKQRRTLAGAGAEWCAQKATFTWAIAPDHNGELEFTFSSKHDLEAFRLWLGRTFGGHRASRQ